MKVIAEISGNHCNDERILESLVYQSIQSGVDIVKMQLFEAKNLVPKNPTDEFPIYDSGIWRGRGGFEILSETETHPKLVNLAYDICCSENVDLMISIFDPSDLNRIPVGWKGPIKIASLEADYLRLIDAFAIFETNYLFRRGLLLKMNALN